MRKRRGSGEPMRKRRKKVIMHNRRRRCEIEGIGGMRKKRTRGTDLNEGTYWGTRKGSRAWVRRNSKEERSCPGNEQLSKVVLFLPNADGYMAQYHSSTSHGVLRCQLMQETPQEESRCSPNRPSWSLRCHAETAIFWSPGGWWRRT